MASTNKLIFFFLCIFSSSVFSSAQLSVDFKATSFQQLLKTNTGLLTSTKFTGRNIAGRAVYGLRTVPIAKSIVGNVLKNRSFSPWGFAITAAITAAGYYYDQNTQQVLLDEGGSGQYSTALGRCEYLSNNVLVDVTYSVCVTEVVSLSASADPYSHTTLNSPGFFFLKKSSGSNIGGWQVNNGQPISSVIADYSTSPPVQVTDTEIYDTVIPNFSESQISSALKDPQTGLPDEALTPLVNAASDLTNDYDAANDADPNTDPTTDSENDTGDITFTENLDDIPNEDLSDDSSEQQDQCELTPDALGCQEFGDELTEVDIPTEELSFSFSPVSLASDTSCPAPSVMNLSHGSVSLSNQPLCDFFTGVNPVVIAVCSLLAIYILTGGVQRG